MWIGFIWLNKGCSGGICLNALLKDAANVEDYTVLKTAERLYMEEQ